MLFFTGSQVDHNSPVGFVIMGPNIASHGAGRFPGSERNIFALAICCFIVESIFFCIVAYFMGIVETKVFLKGLFFV